jgi:CheY-like chemotaxis protein
MMRILLAITEGVCVVQVILGPVSAASARAWLGAARGTVAQIRIDLALDVPTWVAARFGRFLDEWEPGMQGDVFEWSGDVEPSEVREMAAHWFRLAKLARERPESGLRPAPPEGEEFYDALVLAMAEAASFEDNQGFAAKFEEVAPAFAPPQVRPSPRSRSTNDNPDPARRVLLVDDTADIRLLIRVALEFDPRFEVFGEASDGQEALDAMESMCPDLVLLDIMMPVMDGFTALPLLREKCPDVKVVVLSAVDEVGSRRRATELGADAFLNKMAAMDEIISTLAEVS